MVNCIGDLSHCLQDNFRFKREDLTQNLMEQNKTLNKEIKEIKDTLEKTRISLETELNIEKEQQKKLLHEIAKVNRLNKDLKSENQALQNRVSIQEKEIEELRAKVDSKGNSDPRLQERDLNLYQKKTTRTALTTNNYDPKMATQIRTLEVQKDRLEEENTSLHKEIVHLREQMKSIDHEKTTMRSPSREYMGKVSHLEKENSLLLKDNESLKHKLDKLSSEVKSYKEDAAEIHKKYDELKQKYCALEALTPNKGGSIKLSEFMEFTPTNEHARINKSVSTSKKTTFFNTETVKTDPDVHYSPKVSMDLSDLTFLDAKKTISEVTIMKMFNVKSYSQIIPAIAKTEKVMQAVPRLQKIVSEVAKVVLPRSGYADLSQVDLIVPILKNWSKELNEVDERNAFREKVLETLHLKKESSNTETIKKIEGLMISHFDNQKQSTHDSLKVNNVVEQFATIFKVKADAIGFKQILKMIEQGKEFADQVKQKLGVERNTSNEACLNQLNKIIDTFHNIEKRTTFGAYTGRLKQNNY